MNAKTFNIIGSSGKTIGYLFITILALLSARCNSDEGQILLEEDASGVHETDNEMDEDSKGNPLTQVTRITPGGINEGDFFGYEIAANETFTVASAPFSDEKGQRTGAVYIFMRNGTKFENTAHIIYPELATTEDYFGWSIALDGEVLVVGAPRNDSMAENAGLAYVYEHVGNNNWNMIRQLAAPNPQPNQEFGTRVAIEAETIAISSKFDDDNYFDEGDITNGAGVAQGSVFLFENVNNWEYTQKLIPNSGQGHKWDAFGAAIAIQNGSIAVGAPGTDNTTYKFPGSVYVFKASNETWTLQSRIEASDGKSEDFFGVEVVLDDADLAIGASGSFNSLLPNSNQAYGAIYTFVETGEIWKEDSKLIPDDVLPGDNFGGSGLAFHEAYLVAGASLSEELTAGNGAIYFFKRESGWPESHKVIAPDPLNEDLFGSSVAATTDLIFAGAHRRCNETGCWAGALYFIQ
ncbi:MAG: FG-GAP repeat protein [Maribacter sp.]|uniref:FG-GAP repeat protein n=1 Tax=Maribacter sp. TaxID=1897614 RepID=UPI00329A25BB